MAAKAGFKELSPYEAQQRIDKLHKAEERLVGLHVAPQPGLKVVLSKQVSARCRASGQRERWLSAMFLSRM